MASHIISIEYEIPGFSDRHASYLSDASILDADWIVFQPPRFGGTGAKASYSESYSEQLQTATEHWRKELRTALDYGKTVFLIVVKHELAQVYTGRKEVKGSRTINYLMNVSNYDFVPVSLPELVAKGGSAIVFKGHPVFSAFWAEFRDDLTFESYLDGPIETPVFVTKTGEKVVGGVVKSGKGHLVLIPAISYDEDAFTRKKPGKGDEYEWTKKGVAFGSRLVAALDAIDRALRSDRPRTPPPNWVGGAEYLLKEENRLGGELEKAASDLAGLLARQRELELALKREGSLRDLLFETGKPLEEAVSQALTILGYSAENYDDGMLELDQVIVSPEGERYIGECEGKDSSAVNIDKFRQLADNIQADLQRDEVERPAVGILFGNGYRLTPPKDRPNQFTVKCLESAKRGTVLVRTADLFDVARYVKESKDKTFAASGRKALTNSVGGITEFPTVPKVSTGI